MTKMNGFECILSLTVLYMCAFTLSNVLVITKPVCMSWLFQRQSSLILTEAYTALCYMLFIFIWGFLPVAFYILISVEECSMHIAWILTLMFLSAVISFIAVDFYTNLFFPPPTPNTITTEQRTMRIGSRLLFLLSSARNILDQGPMSHTVVPVLVV